VPKIVVLPNVTGVGWSGKGDDLGQAARGRFLELEEALCGLYPTAACLQAGIIRYPDGSLAYEKSDHQPRLRESARSYLTRAGVEVVFESIWVDIDNKPHERPDQAWYEELIAVLRRGAPKGWGYYPTPRGSRIFWELSPALPWLEYIRVAGALTQMLQKLFADHGNVHIDTGHQDPVHLFYLPCATVDGVPRTAQPYLREMAPLNVDDVLCADPLDLLVQQVAEGAANVSGRFVLPEKIPHGERNRTLFRYTCSLISRGLEQPAILTEVWKAYSERAEHSPPIYFGEIERMVDRCCLVYEKPAHIQAVPATLNMSSAIAENLTALLDAEVPIVASGTESTVAVTPLTRSSVAIATYALDIIKQSAGGVDPVYDRGSIYVYEPHKGFWEPLAAHELAQFLYTFDGRTVQAGIRADGSPQMTRLELSHPKVCNDIIPTMKNMCHKPDFFMEGSAGVAFANGFCRVTETGIDLVQHSPEHRALYSFPFDYSPVADPQGFFQFLRELFEPDDDWAVKIQLLREFFSIALLGLAPRYETVLFLVGEGANGKSTLVKIVRGLIERAGGRRLITSVAPHDMSPSNYAFATLAHAFFNFVPDAPAHALKDTSAFKAVVSGDPVSGREIYAAPFTFVSKAATVISQNRLPQVADSSAGFWRRANVLAFNRSFSDQDKKRDYAQTLLDTEAEAIVCWLVGAAVDVIARNGFVAPPSSVQLLAQWRTASNSVLEFLSDILESTESSQFLPTDSTGTRALAATQLYFMYKSWCDQSGRKPFGKVEVLNMLSKLGIARVQKPSGTTLMMPSREVLGKRLSFDTSS
jgi:P4 family phage/plasmid primase-like protien